MAVAHVVSATAVCVAVFVPLDRLVRLGRAEEAAFWGSGTTAAAMRAYDAVAAVRVMMVMRCLMRKFGRPLGTSVAAWSRPGELLDAFAWSWHLYVYTGLAIVQVAALVAAPAAYSRRRRTWMVLLRALRVGMTALQAGLVARRSTRWQLIAEGLRGEHAPAAKFLFTYSGALMAVLHSLNHFLPLRWAALHHLLVLVATVPGAPALASELLSPQVLPSYVRLCRPVVGTLGDLTGLYMTDEEAEAWCEQHPQEAVVACQVVVGAVVPLALVAAIEGAAKHVSMRLRQAQAQQTQQAQRALQAQQAPWGPGVQWLAAAVAAAPALGGGSSVGAPGAGTAWAGSGGGATRQQPHWLREETASYPPQGGAISGHGAPGPQPNRGGAGADQQAPQATSMLMPASEWLQATVLPEVCRVLAMLMAALLLEGVAR